ncbi:MAG: ATP synthase F1 subunit delta [Bacilli bacterium]|jgi:F-type H+-transporting ATPase subunit delta|nr:ATP synthase F1 subunit delta [Bacilli bacterium]MDD3389039.1 ATP synthase F1 subunit delta [Bacilli bacterium]MDD4344478.1 ATP synthase F1 subunit delta [Bacilli bacterium]MDD4520618.1 ATP synthase F1 subunit delta [Bacilli bacterium]MDY0399407.1 ATP synthase F1 subunit delta [Bacilli bacterium]
MNQVALRYAHALISIAQENNEVEAYKNALIFVNDLLKNNESFYKYLTSEFVTKNERKKTLEKVLADLRLPDFITFLKLVIDRRRLRELPIVTREFVNLANKILGIDEGIIYSAVALSDDDVKTIEEKMTILRGTKVELINRIDERLIGGIKVIIRDQVYDGTLLAKITELKSHLQRTKAVKL